MIITTNNNTITVGPAWPCCYEYPTQAPNITGNHENVSFEEIKRRFYNSIKTMSVTLPTITPYVGTYLNGNVLKPNGLLTNSQNHSDQEAYDLAAECCSIISGKTYTLYGNTWFHSDDNGYGFGPFYSLWQSAEFFATNSLHDSFTLNGVEVKVIVNINFIGNLGPETTTFNTEYQAQNLLILVFLYDPETLTGFVNPFITLTFGKKCNKNLNTFTNSDFSGNYGPSTKSSYASISYGNEYFVSDTIIQREIIGSINLDAYYDSAMSGLIGFKTLFSSLIADDFASATATAPTTSDWNFDLNGLTIASSGQNQFQSITTPGQDLNQINDLLNAPSLNYTATGAGIFKHDPSNIGIGNYPGWPETMYYDCRKFVPATVNSLLDLGGIFFNSPSLNYYNSGAAFYLKPYLILMENLSDSYPYNNGILTHPDAPISNNFPMFANAFLYASQPGDYLFTGVKMSTPYKYISVYFDFFQYRINRSQAGGAYIGGYMPPFQDW